VTADQPAASKNRVAALFGLKGEAWMRHANPWSVWTRFAVVPLLAPAIWSRDWIGWWCLLPIVLLIVWLGINPLFFDRPATTKHWVSRSVFGERIWSETSRDALPVEFRSKVPGVAQAYQAVGLAILIYGLAALDAIATVSGVLITQGGKVWYLDRMVLLFEAMKTRNPEFASWEY
jgi:hypothetical protein